MPACSRRRGSRPTPRRHRSLVATWCLPQNVQHAAAGRIVNELQLLGYTADYGFLVFSAPDDESVRFRVQADADLVQTLREITERQDPPPTPLEEPKSARPAARKRTSEAAAKI